MKYILYDASCSLCCIFVKYFEHKDSQNVLVFLDQNTKIAKKLIPIQIQNNTCSLESIIFIKDKQYFTLSDALIQILLELPFPTKIIGYLLYCIPKFLRDFLYKKIASNRKNLSKYLIK